MTPKISVVIPSFNKSKFIGQTLESIISQKYENLEVIIQDGGSTDGTLEIIKRYANKYPHIFKWESKKDNGQLDAINKGIKKATGDILTYINADDLYERDTFQVVGQSYKSNLQALWFAGQSTVIDSKGHEIAKLISIYKIFLLTLNRIALLLTVNYLMQPSVFITRKAYEKHGPFTGTSDFVTEYDLWLRLAKIHMPIVINQTLSKFRIEESTKTKNMTRLLLKEDRMIVGKFTKNPLILFLHDLNNLGRLLVDKFV